MFFRNRKLVYIAAASVLLVVAFVLPSSCSRKGKGVVREVVAPAERGTSGLGQRLSEAAAAIRGIGGAVEKNRELSHELVRVQAELNQLRDVEAENVRLSRALDFYKPRNHAMIPCDVVSRNISGWWNTVRIGKGSADGIGENHAVISPDGLVGKTTEVSAHTSEVLLVCDPACRVSAKIERINAFGLVRGMGANLKGHPKARMDFINKDADIRVGDEVVSSGLSGTRGVFPKGVHIGYIEKVYRDQSGLFQSAEIAPRATIGLLDYVFVVSDPALEVKP
ncbi:MAG: rod shape-determining protein MreC [Kiritimatiellales bacterium]|nr:rod shape-determining protein MreC [Kiritimatiellales bacterium]MCF7864869.1 rod shape-determining protein MreC [Kiritimatiellales bacterium]